MKSAGYIAVVGGILLVIGGAAGSALPAMLYQFVKDMDLGEQSENIKLVLRIFVFLAALGGFAVIGGGYAITKDWARVGKVLIFLGCALGLLGLILNIIIAVATSTWDGFMVTLMTTTGLGSVLAVVAYQLA